jgi:hypothetical protein
MNNSEKPLGIKAYGSIPHLPGSRTGTGDHTCSEGEYTICCKKARDKHDVIIVQEKLDGSCVSVAKLNGEVVALIRSGYLAKTSKHEQHRMFAYWVALHQDRFDSVLREGERICGEWLALAHGTIYKLHHEPFVAFDLFEPKDDDKHGRRVTFGELVNRLDNKFVLPNVISQGNTPRDINYVLKAIETSAHGAEGPAEGSVWRVERQGEVNFLAKYVRHDKEDGCYLPDLGKHKPIWNWKPGMVMNRLSDEQLTLARNAIQQLSKTLKLHPEPRYDVVYYEGLEWLNKQ